MTTRRALLLLVAVSAILAGPVAGASAASGPEDVVSVPVSFSVVNTNTSKAACPSDGARYTVRGQLVGPRAALGGGSRATVALYYHGLGLTGSFWHFTDVPGYDYASELARAGNVSLVVDRLGYGASDRPPGAQVCYGSQADVGHQIVGALRSGGYATAAGPAPRFGRVLLAGHAAEGFSAQVEAVSYDDIDGLLIFAFADTGATPAALPLFGAQQTRCQAGGDRSDGSTGPSGYAFFGQTDADFQRGFFDADPAVVAAVTAQRRRDPCGETASAPAAGAVDAANLSSVHVPVLLVAADHDAFFSTQSEQNQRNSFTGTRDLTLFTAPDTGSLVTLGRSAPAVRGAVATWLRDHAFSAPIACPNRRAAPLRLRRGRQGRIVRASVYVNGGRVATRRGRSLRAIDLPALPPEGRLSVKVVTVSATRIRRTSVRDYDGCTKSRAHVVTRRVRGARGR